LGWTRYWVKANSFYENVKSTLYFGGKNLDDYRRQIFSNYLSINRQVSNNAMASIGFFQEWVKYRPRVRATDKTFLSENFDTITQLSLYKYNAWGVQCQYQFNTLNARLFPTKGAAFNLTARLPLSGRRFSHLDFVYKNAISDTYKEDDRPSRQYVIAVATAQWVKPVSKKMQLTFDAAMGKYFNVETIPADAELALLFGVGGVETRNNNIQLIPFWGYREGYSLHSTFATGRMGLQINPIERFYLTPALSFLYGDGFVINTTQPRFESNIEASWGINVGFKMPVGVVQFNFSQVQHKSINTYLSLGVRF
jgi:hypothetical protein